MPHGDRLSVTSRDWKLLTASGLLRASGVATIIVWAISYARPNALLLDTYHFTLGERGLEFYCTVHIGMHMTDVPSRSLVVVLPYWLLLAVFCTLLACVTIIERRRGLREGTDLCKNCGYDLRATPDRCPECGRRVKKTERRVTGMSSKG